MVTRKVLYQGDSTGLFHYNTFVQFMEGKGQRIPYENGPLQRMELYSMLPTTTLMYLAKKRIIPRGMNLWSVTVSVHGSDIEGVEKMITEAMRQFTYSV